MVKDTLQLDEVFHSLADPTRRDILNRVAAQELSVGQLAEKYDVSFVAISKHLKVLEKARLISKRKDGRKYMVALKPDALLAADIYLEQYRRRWQSRYEKLDSLLKEGEQ
ncbi:MAG TPA: metalloregulator ArsR/SmtB family transcription factor [Candidatus Saccharimonadales bacterium]|nr:metalloregulator ArsR/SmtB family transcription factor [Candidatus Saccharimonadales bacterium]